MSLQISPSDLQILQHESELAARHLIRRLRLPYSELADLRQDLLLDLIARLPGFDPKRGSLGAFVGTVAKHKSAGIARRIHHEHQLFGAEPISIDDPDRCGLRETVPDDAGLGSLLGGVCDAHSSMDLARDVIRSVSVLPAALRDLCALLQSEIPTAACRKSGLSRATFYRRLREIRLSFLVSGLRTVA